VSKAELRGGTGAARTRKEPLKQPLPSALQPNFVADKSSQIWSEVASIKSQSYVNQPSPMDEKQIHKQQHEELIRQINTRG